MLEFFGFHLLSYLLITLLFLSFYPVVLQRTIMLFVETTVPGFMSDSFEVGGHGLYHERGDYSSFLSDCQILVSQNAVLCSGQA